MKLLVLPGDGIGPEIVQAALDVLQAADQRFALGLEFEHDEVGFASLHRHGTTLRPEVLERARQCDGVILGTPSTRTADLQGALGCRAFTGRAYSVPCDAAGHVDMDALSERERDRYLYARAVIGCEFSMPRKQRCATS